MNNQINFSQPEEIVKGREAFTIEPGKFVKVIKHKDGSNCGDVLMKISSEEHPFVGLADGSLWGNSLENYEFLVLPYNIINLDVCNLE